VEQGSVDPVGDRRDRRSRAVGALARGNAAGVNENPALKVCRRRVGGAHFPLRQKLDGDLTGATERGGPADAAALARLPGGGQGEASQGRIVDSFEATVAVPGVPVEAAVRVTEALEEPVPEVGELDRLRARLDRPRDLGLIARARVR